MAKRGRPRKPVSGTDIPPPDRREFERTRPPHYAADLLRLQLEAPRPLTVIGPSHEAVRSPHLLADMTGERRRNLQPPPPIMPARDEVLNRHAEAAPESISIPMSCAKTGQRLVVWFGHGVVRKWQVREVVRDASIAGGGGPAAQKIEISDFDFSGAQCPECKSALGPIACGRCQILGCEGGKSIYSGAPTYTCPHCKISGRITHGLKEVDAVKLGEAARTAGSTRDRNLNFLLAPPARRR